MTIAEAASLVLRSAAFGSSGGLFVLDMGQELRIVDLAERLVRARGLRPHRDVEFRYTGLRPGEKLHEELAGPGEQLAPTDHPFVRRVDADYSVDPAFVLDAVRDLDRRRQAGTIAADAFPAALRALIGGATRPRDLAPVA